MLGRLLRTVSAAFAQCNRIGEQVCQPDSCLGARRAAARTGLVIAGEQCRAPVDSLAGIWSGSGHQSGGSLPPEDYPVIMTIDQGGASIDYPSLRCGGKLVELANGCTATKYREQITYGKCLDGGVISVNLAGDRLAWTGPDPEA